MAVVVDLPGIADDLGDGFETTIEMLSGTLASCCSTGGALSEVRSDHDRIDGAIDEAFRWAYPSTGLYRVVTEDTDPAGPTFTQGSMVYLGFARHGTEALNVLL